VAPQIGRLDSGMPGGENDHIAVEREPDRRDMRPAVGAHGRELGGARPLQQECVPLFLGHLVHRLILPGLNRSTNAVYHFRMRTACLVLEWASTSAISN